MSENNDTPRAVEELERLWLLHKEGALSRAEFEAQKAILLNEAGPSFQAQPPEATPARQHDPPRPMRKDSQATTIQEDGKVAESCAGRLGKLIAVGGTMALLIWAVPEVVKQDEPKPLRSRMASVDIGNVEVFSVPLNGEVRPTDGYTFVVFAYEIVSSTKRPIADPVLELQLRTERGEYGSLGRGSEAVGDGWECNSNWSYLGGWHTCNRSHCVFRRIKWDLQGVRWVIAKSRPCGTWEGSLRVGRENTVNWVMFEVPTDELQGDLQFAVREAETELFVYEMEGADIKQLAKNPPAPDAPDGVVPPTGLGTGTAPANQSASSPTR